MKIYNTLTKKIEDFKPVDNEVKLYTCGLTVYNYAHIGNLRTYIFEDILERSLKFLGYNVKRVMNITDVGHLTGDVDTGKDKMVESAKEQQKSVLEIAEFYTEAFLKDFEKLSIIKPDILIKATDEIDEYIKIIEKLIETNYAYIANGNVYFDVSTMPNYYQLSGRNSDDLKTAVRSDVEEDKNKKNPEDFVLWFTTSKFEDQILKWDSPWGVGYPGWHIECSGIALKYLGERIDIHCGGVDNIFPHHTNEIAQSEAYLGHKWCNYWMHGEFLGVKNAKMSKSSGGFIILNDLLEKGYNPLSYRFFALQSHYQNQLEFSFEALDTAENTYDKLKSKIQSIKNDNTPIQEDKIEFYKREFGDALANNLNTSLAITTLYDLLKDNEVNNNTKISIIELFDQVLGLDLLKQEEIKINEELKRTIEEKIEQRKQAKLNKDYALADQIREELASMNVILEDTKEGTKYTIER